MRSLHGRLLLAASLVLAGFLGMTGVVLDAAFRTSAEASTQTRLQSRVYALLGAVDEDAQGRMVLPQELPDPAFSKPDSGLYAMVVADSGQLFWRSPSLTGQQLDMVLRQEPGQQRFEKISASTVELFVINYGVAWEDNEGREHVYTFAVAEDAASFQTEVESFRATLWIWLGGLALGLLLVQGGILGWGLRPLRTVAADLQEIEKGASDSLKGDYPHELKGLTASLNSLMRHSSNIQRRYRNSLDDLAHSLKTPLALLQSVSEDSTSSLQDVRKTTIQQVDRMSTIVRHQLQRAAASGRAALAPPTPVAQVVERLVQSLDKVYRDKQVQVSLDLDPASSFTGDETDLFETLGNLIENAYKYCDRQVAVTVRNDSQLPDQAKLIITVEDDGPGIAVEQVEQMLQRGKRGDETLPGHGIGLAMVCEIIELYAGKLEFDRSQMGGALVRLVFISPGN